MTLVQEWIQKRALAQAAIMAALLVAAWQATSYLVRLATGGGIASLFDARPALGTVLGLASLGLFVGAYRLGGHWAAPGRRPDLAWPQFVRLSLVGSGCGAAAMLAIYAAIAVTHGPLSVTAGTLAYLLPNLTVTYAAAAAEELIFRGLLYQYLRQWAGTGVALVASSALFCAAHVSNDGISLLAMLVIFLGGIALAATTELTRSLWPAIAAHFAWNFVLGPLFGASLSGHRIHSAVVVEFREAPGGAFGYENSWHALVVITLVAAAAVAAVYRRRRRPPANAGE